MDLSERQRKFLRGRAHPLEPVILIGNAGLTPGVIAEAQRALHDHELIKVRVRAADRSARDAIIEQLSGATRSTLVHRIGHVAVFYRAREDSPTLVIPDA